MNYSWLFREVQWSSCPKVFSKTTIPDWERACCYLCWACQLVIFLAPAFPKKFGQSYRVYGVWDVVRALKKTWMTNVLAWPVPLCFKWEIGKWLSEDDHCVLWLKPAGQAHNCKAQGSVRLKDLRWVTQLKRTPLPVPVGTAPRVCGKSSASKKKFQAEKNVGSLEFKFSWTPTSLKCSHLKSQRVCNPSQSRSLE